MFGVYVLGAITYEMLFDLLRRERNRDDLQKLDASFFTDVLTYMAQKQASVAPTAMSAESEKARIQFHNIKKILRELYDRREKKIVFLALNAVRTGASMADASSFLPEEQLLFSELKTNFSKYRQEILESVLHQRAPFAGNIPFSRETVYQHTAEVEDDADVTPVVETKSLVEDSDEAEEQISVEEQQPVSTPVLQEAVSEPQDSASLSASHSLSASNSRPIKISFIKAVPRFAGGDEQVFGPFSPGDEATLPRKIASVLVRKGRAQES